MDLVTVKVFNESMQAHILKSKLESEGVECWLIDEHSVSVQPWASLALGGVKLKIRSDDVEKVKQILKEIDEPE